MEVRIEGVEETSKMLNDLAKDTDAKASREVDRTLKKVESTAKSIGTSRWQKRPQVSVPTISATARGTGGYVEVASRGGYFQEIGTSAHPPQPALQPALDAHAPEFYERMKKVAGGD